MIIELFKSLSWYQNLMIVFFTVLLAVILIGRRNTRLAGRIAKYSAIFFVGMLFLLHWQAFADDLYFRAFHAKNTIIKEKGAGDVLDHSAMSTYATQKKAESLAKKAPVGWYPVIRWYGEQKFLRMNGAIPELVNLNKPKLKCISGYWHGKGAVI